ncbi:MAG TPA: YggS family pyridoxal phosphate-dependent enzyme [Saprospiraceae bacterium]|nr:YggS family pyridoxal phosphate-dependent enzyme [Saprospiraceae bacterium]HRO07543.1 YggS family pyridoxal phosphate-dependent enzyme [Saprospiraceae bacterium]HRO72329.1 YggS family pyridoxal phosphate-dependent enzyme [Saprospiraceae bacterium]HRP40826.1 YggS family pyridoxal phosphate-dependent enzyme [Saprospiraceae bacterium]
METIQHNLQVIRKRMQLACERSGRGTGDVKLLLATKTVPPDRIKVAFQLGENLIGENKVQELKEKYEDLSTFPHYSHFIGHLQSGKIKEVIRYVDCIQSVDRLELAEKLQRRLEYEDKSIDVFIQVNTSNEVSKFGVNPAQAVMLAEEITAFDRLNLKGLMTIGLFSSEAEQVRKCFQLLRQIQRTMLEKGYPVEELSMGMSGDLEIAIEEGATIVRVGTAVFGQRIYPDSYYWNEGK